MAYQQPFQTTGFHSCDKKIGLKVLNGETSLNPSKNRWDWLGPGVYFWEQNPARAFEYAEDCAMGKQKNNGRIETPFVIGAIVELGNCLNLLEPGSIGIVKRAHGELKRIMEEGGKGMPNNNGANRMLDCAVIQCVHETNKRVSIRPFDTIRSAFQEGGPIYPGSNFTERLHIQICVINTDLIKGYFLPRPTAEFNPYLKK